MLYIFLLRQKLRLKRLMAGKQCIELFGKTKI